MARPHEKQKRTFSEERAPQPEQVTMRTDCIPQRRQLMLSRGLLFTYPTDQWASSRQTGSYPETGFREVLQYRRFGWHIARLMGNGSQSWSAADYEFTSGF